MSEWQPIETAPKDGTEILACGEYDDPCTVAWRGAGQKGIWAATWQDMRVISSQSDFGTDYEEPGPLSHWMPLPPKPVAP